MSASAAALQGPVRSGDVSGWTGLADLSVTGLTRAFPRDSDWTGTVQLGRNHRQTDYLWACVPDTDRKLRVWFEAERVVLIDFDCTAAFEAGVVAEEPAELDTWLGTLPMPGSELVFPRHGLAAFVNRETHRLWHLALFRPQSLKSYVDNLRLDRKVRRRPEMGEG